MYLASVIYYTGCVVRFNSPLVEQVSKQMRITIKNLFKLRHYICISDLVLATDNISGP